MVDFVKFLHHNSCKGVENHCATDEIVDDKENRPVFIVAFDWLKIYFVSVLCDCNEITPSFARRDDE